MNKKRPTPKYIIVKFQKTVKEKKNYNLREKKTMVTYKGVGIGVSLDYLIATREAQFIQQDEAFKFLKGKLSKNSIPRLKHNHM